MSLIIHTHGMFCSVRQTLPQVRYGLTKRSLPCYRLFGRCINFNKLCTCSPECPGNQSTTTATRSLATFCCFRCHTCGSNRNTWLIPQRAESSSAAVEHHEGMVNNGLLKKKDTDRKAKTTSACTSNTLVPSPTAGCRQHNRLWSISASGHVFRTCF